MDRWIFIDQQTSSKGKKILAEVMIAFLLGIGIVESLYSMFRIPFKSSWGTLKGGLVGVWNQVAETVGMERFFLFPTYVGATGTQLFNIFFSLLATTFAIGLLKTRNYWLLGMVLLPIFLSIFLFKTYPSFLGISLLLTGIGLGSGHFRSREGLRIKHIVAFSVLVIGIALGLNMLLPSKQVSFLEPWNSGKEKILGDVEETFYGKSTLGQGKLTWEKRPEHKGTGMVITSDGKHPEYLRGFVGSVYDENRWETMDSSIYYQMENLMYWLHEEGFNGLSQLGQLEALTNENIDTNKLTIKVEKANRKYGYLTYGMINGGYKEWGGSFITGPFVFPMTDYSYENYSGLWGKWPTLAGEFFTKETSEKVERYQINESHYNVEMYKRYTYLSQHDVEILFENIGASQEHAEYKWAIKQVLSYLEANVLYTENGLGREAEGGLETFFKEKKGYDTHFASAATLMFRYYGIPARYVEGYIVTEEDLKQGKEINISLSNIHAWTEIYVDSVGWVPVEVSPPYKEIMPTPDYTKGLESAIRMEEEYSTEAQGGTFSGKNNGRGEKGLNLKKALIFLFSLLLLIAAFCALYSFWKKWKLARQRDKRFMDKDPTLGICYIYGDMKERRWSLSEETHQLGNKAAYSGKPLVEENRAYMIKQWKKGKRGERKSGRKQRKEKFIHIITSPFGHKPSFLWRRK